MFRLKSLSALLILVTSFLTPAVLVAAEDLSYSYFELGYVNLDIDESDEDFIFQGEFDDGEGWGFRASWELGERFFVYGAYNESNADFSYLDNTETVVPGDVDQIKFNLGVGMHFPINEISDVVVSAAYADIDYDSFDIGRNSDIDWNDLRDDPSDGYHLDVSYRAQFADIVEGSIGVRYTDIQQVDGFSLLANVMYEFTENWGINLSLDAGDHLMTWGLGVRYSL